MTFHFERYPGKRRAFGVAFVRKLGKNHFGIGLWTRALRIDF